MRVLLTMLSEVGHLHLLVPFARELTAAGHELLIASSARFREPVERLGFEFASAGEPMPPAGEWESRFGAPPLTTGDERARFAWSQMFTRHLVGPMLRDLTPIVEDFKPDVIVRESSEFAGYLLAERYDIPHVEVDMHFTMSTETGRTAVAEAIAWQREQLGLPPEPVPETFYKYLQLVTAPPTLLGDSLPRYPTTHFFYPEIFDRSGSEGLPAWADTLGDKPVVYVTLGTVVNDQPALFRTIIEALRDLPIDLIVAPGRAIDPAIFGPQPPNVRLERYIPHSLLFKLCNLILCQTGLGTTLAAINESVPVLALPGHGAQLYIAERCVKAGMACMLEAEERSASSIRAAVVAMLGEPRHREAAARLRADLAHVEGPAHAAGLVARVARTRSPIANEPVGTRNEDDPR